MAESVGYATLDVIPSMRGFRGALERGTGREFERVGKAGGRRLGDAAGKEASGRLKSSLGDAIRGAFAPAAGLLAGAGIVQGFRSVVTAASEAEQSIGGVEAVFGRYADRVLKDSDKASQALGLSANSYRELITVSAAMLKNKGLADFAEQSRNLVKVGADLAAQFGGSTKDAVDALNAAMRGESDPIERYGVSLNETAVNAELARKGLQGLEGAALEQAKTQARLDLITQQTADATGAFARESETLAGAMSRLQAEASNMAAEAGTKLLPVLTSMANFAREDVLPAFQGVGGIMADAARGFSALPGPVKAATGALVAFRGAQALGLTGSAASTARSALQRIGAGMDDLRLRAMLAASEYRTLRSASLTFTNGVPKFTAGVGRMRAGLGALRGAALGAGTAIRVGLGSALASMGGVTGIGIAAVTALVAHFWGEQQAAKAHVEALTGAIDAQTGALDEQGKKMLLQKLEQEGALKAAKDFGLSLDTVRLAALNGGAALDELDNQARRYIAGLDNNLQGRAWREYEREVRDAVAGSAEDVDSAAAAAARLAEANDEAGASGDKVKAGSDKAKKATKDYRTEIDKARNALQLLIDKENERRNKNLSDFQAQTRISQALKDARKEAEEGRKTLDLNTEAGIANRDALASAADAWNNASRKVQSSKGAYDEMRTRFVKIARAMGASKEQAEALAEEMLNIPSRVHPDIKIPGIEREREKVRKLREEWEALRRNRTIQLQAIAPQGTSRPEFGHGLGTAPSVSPNQPRDNGRGVQNQTNIHVDRVETADPGRFLEDMQRRQRLAALGGA